MLLVNPKPICISGFLWTIYKFSCELNVVIAGIVLYSFYSQGIIVLSFVLLFVFLFSFWYCSVDVSASCRTVVTGDNVGNVVLFGMQGEKVCAFLRCAFTDYLI